MSKISLASSSMCHNIYIISIHGLYNRYSVKVFALVFRSRSSYKQLILLNAHTHMIKDLSGYDTNSLTYMKELTI